MIAPVSQYHFDEKAADRACDFFGELSHIKGRKAGERFELEQWQRDDIIRPLFGWKRPDGTRRYRTAYIEIPRKNGKSTICAGIALYLLFCDKEQGAEVYSAAGTRDQARMVFDPACAMVRQVPWLNRNAKILASNKRMVYKNSFYCAIAAEAGTIHGTNPSGIIFDEVHVQPNRELWDTLQTGRGERRQPLTVAITTAGYDRSSICWELHETALKCLENPEHDPTFLPVIYAADPEDPIDDPETWAKANPNLGVSVFPEYLAEESAKAKESPSYENTFRRLHLNQWTEQAVRWMPMDAWDASKSQTDEDSLIGQPCYVGLDLASTRDLTALVALFPDDKGGFDVLCRFFAPKAAASRRDEQDRQSYRGWAGTFIELTEGTSTDQSVVRQALWDWSKKYDVQCVAADPWNMDEFYQQMIREGWPEDKWLMFRQGFGSYNEPMKRCLELVRDKKLRHGGNPVLRWNASNVVAKSDSNQNQKPDKDKSQDKIDGFCALLMGLGLAIQGAGENQTEGTLTFI